ncbi:cyclase family protein [Crocinitomicaceae bacterium]|nr:cyclase family protein [Crocinitomicaceae bacterium]
MIFNIDSVGKIDTSKPLDISLPLSNTLDNPRAWYVDLPIIEPVMENGFVGSVKEGGSVNFRNISFNPHGHGTHTECLGHITPEVFSVNQSLNQFFFTAEVVSINPHNIEGDLIITKEQLEKVLKGKQTEALVIRSLPNLLEKKHLNYTETNPPYLELSCIDVLNACGVKHLLIDLPSVDRESDGGILAFHHAFWQVPQNPQFDKTITEFIYVKASIGDGSYILNLQVAPFENDASPSRPVLYKIF